MESFQDIEHFIKTLSAAIKKKIPTKVSQLTNDAGYKTTDTTYKLSKTGSTVTLTGSDGSTTSVTDDNATYSSLKNPYSLTIQNNGTTVASYDGSTAKTANFTNATSSADGLMSKTDKARLDDIAYSAEGAIDQIVNLIAEEWTGDEAPYSQTVNVTGMTSELLCELFSACSKSATVAERKAYNKAYAIVASGYAETADGSVMFYANEKPSIDIAVRIKSIPKANVVSDQTSISDLQSKLTSLSADLAKQWEKIYPIGSIYISANSTSPASLFGGTWEQIKDRFLLAAGDTYKAGSTGGETTHAHKYGFQYATFYGSTIFESDSLSGVLQGGTGSPVGSTSTEFGVVPVNENTAMNTKNASAAHFQSIADTSSASNMPPYLAVYMWKRTA